MYSVTIVRACVCCNSSWVEHSPRIETPRVSILYASTLHKCTPRASILYASTLRECTPHASILYTSTLHESTPQWRQRTFEHSHMRSRVISVLCRVLVHAHAHVCQVKLELYRITETMKTKLWSLIIIKCCHQILYFSFGLRHHCSVCTWSLS